MNVIFIVIRKNKNRNKFIDFLINNKKELSNNGIEVLSLSNSDIFKSLFLSSLKDDKNKLSFPINLPYSITDNFFIIHHCTSNREERIKFNKFIIDSLIKSGINENNINVNPFTIEGSYDKETFTIDDLYLNDDKIDLNKKVEYLLNQILSNNNTFKILQNIENKIFEKKFNQFNQLKFIKPI